LLQKSLEAESAKANAILGWLPEFNNIEEIIDTAWNWHKKDHNPI
jgi:UDP-glucose 4-epimerase